MTSPAERVVSLVLNAPQAELLRNLNGGWTLGLPWGRGAGKTTAVRWSVYRLIAEHDGRARPTTDGGVQRGVRVVILMPTLTQFRKLYAAALEAELAPGGQFGFLGARINRSTWEVRFPGGSTIRVFGTANALAALGQRVDWLFVDECDGVDPATIDAVARPWFTEPWSMRGQVFAGTPRRGRHGVLYRVWARANGGLLRRDGKRFERHHARRWTGWDTPRNVSREELEAARAELDPELYKREYLCDFDAAEGLVYPDFSPEFHVCEPHPSTRFEELVGGVDHGGVHPQCLSVLGVFNVRGERGVHVLDEVSVTGRTPDEMVELALGLERRWGSAVRWYADPSRPQEIEMYRKKGMSVHEAENAVEYGIGCVKNLLRVRCDERTGEEWCRLYVDPRCRSLIDEFGLYRRKRDPRDPDRVIEPVEKRHDDMLDSLRYAVATHIGGPGKAGWSEGQGV